MNTIPGCVCVGGGGGGFSKRPNCKPGLTLER